MCTLTPSPHLFALSPIKNNHEIPILNFVPVSSLEVLLIQINVKKTRSTWTDALDHAL